MMVPLPRPQEQKKNNTGEVDFKTDSNKFYDKMSLGQASSSPISWSFDWVEQIIFSIIS